MEGVRAVDSVGGEGLTTYSQGLRTLYKLWDFKNCTIFNDTMCIELLFEIRSQL